MDWNLSFHAIFHYFPCCHFPILILFLIVFFPVCLFSFSPSLSPYPTLSVLFFSSLLFLSRLPLCLCGSASGLLHSGGRAGAGLLLWDSGGVWQRCKPISSGGQPVQHPSAHTQVNPPQAKPTAPSQHPGWYSYDSCVCHFQINPLKALLEKWYWLNHWYGSGP